MKDAIVYFEDDPTVMDESSWFYRSILPQAKLVEGREGSLEEVEEKIQEAGGIEKILAVVTDGHLANDTYGWDVVDMLRQKGYEGPAMYVGGATLPEEKESLYTDVVGKENPGREGRLLKKYMHAEASRV